LTRIIDDISFERTVRVTPTELHNACNKARVSFPQERDTLRTITRAVPCVCTMVLSRPPRRVCDDTTQKQTNRSIKTHASNYVQREGLFYSQCNIAAGVYRDQASRSN